MTDSGLKRIRKELPAHSHQVESQDTTWPYKFDVFLSHSSKDKREVRILAEQLRSAGAEVWLDEKQIMPGDYFIRKIEDGLRDSKWVVIVLSKASRESYWCRAEYEPFIQAEMQKRPTRVIPVMLEPLEEEDIPWILRPKHRLNLGDKEDFKHLIDRVRRPLTVSEYWKKIRQKPVIHVGVGIDGYEIQPSDLLHIMLSSVDFLSSDPLRAIRTKEKPVPITDLLQEFKESSKARLANPIFLLGEAGIGKTTSCRWLSRAMAETRSAVPIYVPLGECKPEENFQAVLDRQIEIGTFDELATSARTAGHQLVLFLDGLNEQGSKTIESILVYVRHLMRVYPLSVVMTSRPYMAVNAIWPGEGVRFFEIQRWTDAQLKNYFRKVGKSDLLDHIPEEVRNCLRLPLLASLVLMRLKKIDEPLPTFRTISSVFDYVLGQFLKKESPILPRDHKRLMPKYEGYLCELAYLMTEQKIVQTTGKLLELVLSSRTSQLPKASAREFKAFLAQMVYSGLLRCSNDIVALDPEASLNELRALKIAFLHQSFQEYLTARRLMSKHPFKLPADVSHDAFWREVPIYTIQSYNSARRQKIFTLSFTNSEIPDYLTSSRLVKEISDPGVRRSTEGLVISRLVSNIAEPSLYHYAIEAFSALGVRGRDALRDCLRHKSSIAKVYARAEAHLDGRVVGPDDADWCRAGRSIYILGELGDMWLAEHLTKKLDSISSLHILYHIGEAFLTLARKQNLNTNERKKIRDAARWLGKLPLQDPVTAGYACAAVRACGGQVSNQARLSAKLESFLIEQSITKRRYFREEFWRRAHGSEAFAEIGDPVECLRVLMILLETEDDIDYQEYKDGDYKQVQSSIIKAVLRVCEKHGAESADWRSLLITVFTSRRINENAWACRHLERLLLKWFSRPSDLEWIKSWKDSAELGGPMIRDVLSNVIFLSN